jgi:hypothetical protein
MMVEYLEARRRVLCRMAAIRMVVIGMAVIPGYEIHRTGQPQQTPQNCR